MIILRDETLVGVDHSSVCKEGAFQVFNSPIEVQSNLSTSLLPCRYPSVVRALEISKVLHSSLKIRLPEFGSRLLLIDLSICTGRLTD